MSCSDLSKPPCFVVCSRAEQIPPCLTSESSLPSPWGTPALSRKRYWSNNRSQSLLVWVFFFCAQLYVNVDFVLCNFNYFLSIWYLCFCFQNCQLLLSIFMRVKCVDAMKIWRTCRLLSSNPIIWTKICILEPACILLKLI